MNNVFSKTAGVRKLQRFILGFERDENMIMYAGCEELSEFVASCKVLNHLYNYIPVGVLGLP